MLLVIATRCKETCDSKCLPSNYVECFPNNNINEDSEFLRKFYIVSSLEDENLFGEQRNPLKYYY